MDRTIEVNPGDRIEYKLRGDIDPALKKRGVGTVLKIMHPHRAFLYGKTYLVRPDGEADIIVTTDEVLRVVPSGEVRE